MIVNVVVNGQIMNRDELSNITISNRLIGDMIQKAGRRQRDGQISPDNNPRFSAGTIPPEPRTAK